MIPFICIWLCQKKPNVYIIFHAFSGNTFHSYLNDCVSFAYACNWICVGMHVPVCVIRMCESFTQTQTCTKVVFYFVVMPLGVLCVSAVFMLRNATLRINLNSAEMNGNEYRERKYEQAYLWLQRKSQQYIKSSRPTGPLSNHGGITHETLLWLYRSLLNSRLIFVRLRVIFEYSLIISIKKIIIKYCYFLKYTVIV